MFENTTPPVQPQNPLNPVMPASGMPSPQSPTPPMAPFSPPQAPVHTMPERFRSAGPAPTGPKGGSSKTKKLIIMLIVVVVVAGLGVGGLYVFNKVVKNSNNANTNTSLVNLVTNRSANLNTTANANVTTENINGTNATNGNTNDANANTNSATNTNVAANSNGNSNANTNAATNTNTTATTPLPSTADSDSDGLTNVEETAYGTDPNNADTDGDTFIDGMQVRADGTVIGELANLYNPKGTGQLEGSSLVKRVQNSTKTYGLLVPTNWTTNESSGLLVITPTVQTGEFFQVRTYDNATSQTPEQWYQANNPQANMSQVKTSAVNGLETLTSEDGGTVYFFKDTKVYGLTYTNGGLSQLNYWTTMAMMTKSFKLVAS